ncbi:MAG: hypothetical protein NC434_00500 [Ruminococcus sp.]|nr:hypothetical protein [Ruminococcus sp.]
MRAFRDRYFEDYVAVPDEKRPGKVKYEYAGQYAEAFVEGKSLKNWKGCIAGAELASILIFLMAGTRDVLFNSYRISAGIGMLALVPWMLEIWSVFRFIVMPNPLKETDRQSIENCISTGSVLHGILLLLMTAVGSIYVVRYGDLAENIFAIAGHMCIGILSFVIWRLYKRVYYHTLPNQAGRKGK